MGKVGSKHKHLPPKLRKKFHFIGTIMLNPKLVEYDSSASV